MSLRVRLLLLGLTGVAVALAVGAVVLYGALTFAVNRTLDADAHATAETVVNLVRDTGPVDPLPVSGAQIVQVIDAHGRVVTASANADRLTPLLRGDERRAALAGHQVTVPGSRSGLDGPLRVTAEATDGGVVLVGVPVGDVLHAQRVLRNALLITYPVLLVVLAVIAWWLIGRTLRPVESLRSGAERISGEHREERLPTPRSADEVQALAVTLNGMLDRLAAARERQRGFVADAAHELRSPLASMRTQLEVAQRLGEGGELTLDLLDDVHRLSALVDDLLLLARADAGERPRSRRESFDTAALLLEITGRYAGARVPVHLAADEGALALGDPGDPLGSIFAAGDREELRRALTNLVDNAVRHAESVVILAARVQGHEAVLTVTDDGPGIPPADRERVFQRFTRLDDGRSRDGGGSGLGLAITRELVRRSGGSVRLVDRPDAPGLTAELRLPR
jgi:signal transduction histidine kinase